jgi:hypothetical protein
VIELDVLTMMDLISSGMGPISVGGARESLFDLSLLTLPYLLTSDISRDFSLFLFQTTATSRRRRLDRSDAGQTSPRKIAKERCNGNPCPDDDDIFRHGSNLVKIIMGERVNSAEQTSDVPSQRSTFRSFSLATFSWACVALLGTYSLPDMAKVGALCWFGPFGSW